MTTLSNTKCKEQGPFWFTDAIRLVQSVNYENVYEFRRKSPPKADRTSKYVEMRALTDTMILRIDSPALPRKLAAF